MVQRAKPLSIPYKMAIKSPTACIVSSSNQFDFRLMLGHLCQTEPAPLLVLSSHHQGLNNIRLLASNAVLPQSHRDRFRVNSFALPPVQLVA
jgi:hypothetical protein